MISCRFSGILRNWKEITTVIKLTEVWVLSQKIEFLHKTCLRSSKHCIISQVSVNQSWFQSRTYIPAKFFKSFRRPIIFSESCRKIIFSKALVLFANSNRLYDHGIPWWLKKQNSDDLPNSSKVAVIFVSDGSISQKKMFFFAQTWVFWKEESKNFDAILHIFWTVFSLD